MRGCLFPLSMSTLPSALQLPSQLPHARERRVGDGPCYVLVEEQREVAARARGVVQAEGAALVEHEEGSSKIVIFISHTWWDRSFTDATNDPNNPYDVGAPDLQADYPDEQRRMCVNAVLDKYEMVTYQRPKNLKWRIICAGVQRLLEQEGLKEEEVSLWVDWQSIYQDDEAEKLKGVISLIRYATLCQYMLVPTEEAQLDILACMGPHEIPAYGSRGWW